MTRRHLFVSFAAGIGFVGIRAKLLALGGWKDVPGPGSPTLERVAATVKMSLNDGYGVHEYEIRTVQTMWYDSTYPVNDGWTFVEVQSAFTIPTPDGSRGAVYIGSVEDAAFLVEKKGLRQLQPRIGGSGKICSIGFCPADGKWYGWSHRAIYGFSEGDRMSHSTVTIENWEQAKLSASRFAESVS